MKFYEITITPTSPFGTLLKGDTLFGHFCWQVVHDPELVKGGLAAQLECYENSPFVVFSSAFPKTEQKNTQYFLPRPEAVSLVREPVTAKSRKQRLLEGKALKKKPWMALDNLNTIELANVQFLTGEEVAIRVYGDRHLDLPPGLAINNARDIISTISQPHNTINRQTGTTGPGLFAPYSRENQYYIPGTTLAIFLLLDESSTDIQRVCKGLERIGTWGFGRDASTGMGRFTVNASSEIPLPLLDTANACYTLAPSVPPEDVFTQTFFTPFVRFGKHGDRLATGKVPFKRPVVMADEGGVFIPDTGKRYTTPWLGNCVADVSYAERTAVAQGYSPWLPIKMEL